MNRLLAIVVVTLALVGCGGSSSGDDVDAGGNDPCGFGSDRYLPYQVGFSWEFRVTDLSSGDVATKSQIVDSEFTDPDDSLPALLQITDKDGGKTENWIRVVDDATVRLRQQDFNSLDELIRTSVYDPSAVRLDETPAHLVEGAEWDESYTQIDYDPNDVETARIETTEHWEVLGVDVDCSSPLGDFKCLHVKRTRTQGGVAVKEYMFARGIGKIREDGGQVEQLTACSVAQ